ncbi:aldo/keto reductase family oxidoreductase [Roseobacter sp. HKCCA0434]|uniref:aldo/keto reductase n=1 Tax=Roseobacter sp. HKCCA0434 TaxID=3079297 RepID=UPI002905956E|nr:aldo/keto reductase [Roseobacter sp. HKCCA0434]
MTGHLPIGRTRGLAGREVGALAYGCWRFGDADEAQVVALLGAARVAGMDVLDTAAIYGFGSHAGFGGAERQLGAALRAAPSLAEGAVIVTKGGIEPPLPYDSRAEALTASLDASLKRLGVERVDLFLVHRPDLLAGHAEVGRALDAMVASGKAGAVGVSNYSPAQTRALQAAMQTPLAVTQPEISAATVDALSDGTLDLAQELSLLPMAWSPLGGGELMTGSGPVQDALDAIATANGTDRAAAALGWLLAHPAGIMPIVGSQTPARIRAAADAYQIKMTRRDWYAVLEASLGHPMP